MAGLVISLFVCGLTGWNLWVAATKGVIHGRSGAGWNRIENPAVFWICTVAFGLAFIVFAAVGLHVALQLIRN